MAWKRFARSHVKQPEVPIIISSAHESEAIFGWISHILLLFGSTEIERARSPVNIQIWFIATNWTWWWSFRVCCSDFRTRVKLDCLRDNFDVIYDLSGAKVNPLMSSTFVVAWVDASHHWTSIEPTQARPKKCHLIHNLPLATLFIRRKIARNLSPENKVIISENHSCSFHCLRIGKLHSSDVSDETIDECGNWQNFSLSKWIVKFFISFTMFERKYIAKDCGRGSNAGSKYFVS